MIPEHIEPERIRILNDADPAPGKYVLYWMQQSQRTSYNHALDYAIAEANAARLPVVVGFGLTADYPDANLRHYRFMMEGLREVAGSLASLGIRMAVRFGNTPDVALKLGRSAALIVCDCGYQRHQKQWRRQVAENAGRRVIQVESDVVVPLHTASQKSEYAARTIRPKIHRHLSRFLRPAQDIRPDYDSLSISVDGLELDDPGSLLEGFSIDRSVTAVSHFHAGGTREADRRLRVFIDDRLAAYADGRKPPHKSGTSFLSPYLHFGQISPVRIALQAMDATHVPETDREAFLEELIVRRELAMNFVNFNSRYDDFDGLPEWAQKTLAAHEADPREHLYSQETLESAGTHDPYWNAAMEEMRITGYLQGYMRMYWGKKILEWMPTPQQAFDLLLHLNNKYFLDGRDANSFTGVAWIFGLHDRPWKERPIFGKVRYMAASGLERKFPIRKYVEKIDHLKRKHG